MINKNYQHLKVHCKKNILFLQFDCIFNLTPHVEPNYLMFIEQLDDIFIPQIILATA